MREHVRKMIPRSVHKRLGARGVAMVEYSVLLLLAMPIVAGIIAGGSMLAISYRAERLQINRYVP